MARSADTTTRITRLESALKRAKALPKGAVLDAEPMRQLVGISWVALRAWCDKYPAIEASNAFVRGGNGVKWQFNAVATIEGFLGVFRAEGVKARKRNREIQTAVGVTLPDDESGASLDEVRQMVRLTLEVQKTKQDQHNYVPAEKVSAFLDGYNRAVVEAIMGVGTEADPTGKMPPAVTAEINELLRNVAARVHARAQEFIEECRASPVEAGTG